jgi:hypothetical protein
MRKIDRIISVCHAIILGFGILMVGILSIILVFGNEPVLLASGYPIEGYPIEGYPVEGYPIKINTPIAESGYPVETEIPIEEGGYPIETETPIIEEGYPIEVDETIEPEIKTEVVQEDIEGQEDIENQENIENNESEWKPEPIINITPSWWSLLSNGLLEKMK